MEALIEKQEQEVREREVVGREEKREEERLFSDTQKKNQ